MVVIQMQIGKKCHWRYILRWWVRNEHHVTKQLKIKVPKPKLTPYNMQMEDQTTTNPIGLIKTFEDVCT
jgi:hypothetical protein